MNSRDGNVKKEVLKICPNRCLFCGYDIRCKNGNTLLEGAHVRKFSDGSQYDDPHNMILLCPNHHTEYDNDLIDFTPDGIIHHYYKDNPCNDKTVEYDISYLYPGYIKYHNKRSFINTLYSDL